MEKIHTSLLYLVLTMVMVVIGMFVARFTSLETAWTYFWRILFFSLLFSLDMRISGIKKSAPEAQASYVAKYILLSTFVVVCMMALVHMHMSTFFWPTHRDLLIALFQLAAAMLVNGLANGYRLLREGTQKA